MKGSRQVHCWLDCYAHLIEQTGHLDYRPMYIGVWNAAFKADEHGIYYFSDEADAMNWPERFERLYGRSLKRWLDYGKGKKENFALLQGLIRSMGNKGAILVIVDLFWIPYTPQYQAKHTPHVIILKEWDRMQGQWRYEDPYLDRYGWIGHDELEAAFYYEDLAMGVLLDTSELHAPDPAQIRLLMEEESAAGPGLLIGEVERFLSAACGRKDGGVSKLLFSSIEQVGVISKRMNGYAPVLQYFAGDEPGEAEAGVKGANELVKLWESLMLSLARLAVLGNRMDYSKIEGKLRELEAREAEVKAELLRVYRIWDEVTPKDEVGGRT
ncbi:DUF6005 family protein [Paenibacillus sp. M1]|uniref:DUF6005 family protein n=1 Tax=Paenibacillus haidiansis TaxID=1574488 RepID=A0ABU7VQS4_9BACL